MSAENTGNVDFEFATIIWSIPESITTDARKKDLRLLSPNIDLDFINSMFESNSRIELRIFIEPPDETVNRFVRLGMVNDRDEEICSCYDAGNAYTKLILKRKLAFWVPIFLTSTKFNELFEEKGDSYVRIYYEEIENIFKKGNGSNDVDKVPDLGESSKELPGNENKENISCVCSCKGNKIQKDLKSLDIFSHDFQHLLTNSEDSDLTIKIKGRDFNVHKLILKARSPVFHAMLTHNLSESRDGIVNIKDCEPEVFEAFLLYIYSGKTENINSDNACGLYYLSDKYDLPDLKEKCLEILKISFTLENICEIVCLATTCNEAELLQLAINYFANHMEEIMATCNWLVFMKDNPVEANELCLKALKLGFKKIKKDVSK